MPRTGPGINTVRPRPSTILMVAGEASGDLHGGNLAREILSQQPDLEIHGIGGDHMKESGVHLLHSIDQLAVVGIFEVLGHLKVIRQTFHSLARFIKEKRPDLIILIDYPDFNLRLAKVAKQEGLKVLYYISPQVWAWRRGRIKTIARYVNTLLIVFAFEEAFYQNSGLDVRFIGHPLLDLVKPTLNKEEACRRMGIDPKRPIIGLLPGSRRSEIRFILPVFLEVAKRISQENPKVQFILAQAPTISQADLKPYLQRIGEGVHLHCQAQATYDIISLADLVLVSSGTATLETALLNTPMILVYKLSFFTYLLASLLIRVPYIGLVNLVAGQGIVPELIQGQANPKRISALVEGMLKNPEQLQSMRQELKKVRGKLGQEGSLKRAAKVVFELLESNHSVPPSLQMR